MDALLGRVAAVVALLAALAIEFETLWFLPCLLAPLPPRPKRLLKPPVDSPPAAADGADGSSRMTAPSSAVGPGDFVRVGWGAAGSFGDVAGLPVVGGECR